MTPYEQLVEMKGAEYVHSAIAYCAQKGIVAIDDEVLVCAYQTSSKALKDPKYEKVLDKPDCWYVYVLAGDMKKAMSIVEPTEFVAFQRFDGRVRIYRWSRLWEVLQSSSRQD